jgi:hypothetical protein
MPLPVPYTPLVPGVVIDPVDFSQQVNPFGNFTAGVFVQGGNLYAVLYGEGGIASEIQLAESTNDGASWSLLDSAHAPTANNTAVWYESGGLVYVGVQQTPGGAVAFSEFDLSTGLWAASTIANITVNHLHGLAIRGDGSAVLITDDILGGGSSGFSAFVFSAGSWNAGTDLGAQFFAASFYTTNYGVDNPKFCSDGVTLYIATTFTDGTGDQIMMAVSFAGASVINSFIFPTNSSSMPPQITTGTANNNGWPCLVGSTLILPVFLKGSPTTPDYPSVFVSFDSGASWALLDTPGIDPPQYAAVTGVPYQMSNYAPAAVTDGTNLYLVYGFLAAGDTTLLRVCITSPIGTDPAAWTWSCSTGQDIANYTGAGYRSWESPFLTYVAGQASLLLAAGIATEAPLFRTPMMFLGSFSSTPGAGGVTGSMVGAAGAGFVLGGT